MTASVPDPPDCCASQSECQDATSEEPIAASLLAGLRSFAAGSDRLVETIEFEPRTEQRSPWPNWVAPKVVEHYRALGVDQPWVHQVEASEAIHRGQHTVLATGTGSGKSLAAWVPILSDLQTSADTTLSDYRSRPTAIYVAPTKALTADQFHGLSRVISVEQPALKVRVATADGDTAREAKDWARSQADIVLTNPDFLHHVLLPANQKWTRLLRGLRYVIIDEAHYWRGVAGSHIALVIRRLLRLSRHLGADPTVVCLSATIANPQVSAAQLIGVIPEVVATFTRDTSAAGRRTLLLWQPPLLPESTGSLSFIEDEAESLPVQMERRSATSEAAFLTALLVERGGRMLTFVRSRAGAESVAAYTRDQMALRCPDLGVGSSLVQAYRGGYLPAERRQLEHDLRTGKVRALATTNALELGIDITGLDATVTAGWPGTRASLWQQVGRAGRAGSEGVSVLIASDNPLDNYLVHHPELIRNGLESVVFDPGNPYVLAPHVCAAASELPFTEADLELFQTDVSLLHALANMGYLWPRQNGWYWNPSLPMRPSDLTSLRGDSGQVQIVQSDTGEVVGTVNAAEANAQVFPGAIYVHQSRTYQVRELTGQPRPVDTGGQLGVVSAAGARVALVDRVSTRFRTRPTVQTRIFIVEELGAWESPCGHLRWCLGQVEVETQVTDYDTLRLPGMVFVKNTPLQMPRDRLRTVATWWQCDRQALLAAGVGEADLAGALHGAEHAAIAMLPLLATCDRWDLGGLSTIDHEQTHAPTVFVYDAYGGGAGFSEFGWQHPQQWLSCAWQAITTCDCEDGCPGCVQSPKCGTGNEPLSKIAAAAALKFLLGVLADSNPIFPRQP